jgi:hypothetical protein
MEIKKFDIDNKHVEFVNQSADTRHGFKHMTTMFINGCQRAEHTVHYLNRTWECYRYQTCMRGCVRNELENRIENLKSEFKIKNDYKVLNAKRREEFEEYIKDDNEIKFYNELLEKIGA